MEEPENWVCPLLSFVEKIFPAFLECYEPQHREDLEWKTIVKLAKWHLQHLQIKSLDKGRTTIISPSPHKVLVEIVLRHPWVLCGGWETWEDAGTPWRMTTRSKFQTGCAADVQTQWRHEAFILSQVRNRKFSREQEIFFLIYYKSLQQKHYILLLNFSQEELEQNTFVFRDLEKGIRRLLVLPSGLRNHPI